MENIQEKQCGACEQVLPINEFHKQKSNKTGYQHYCKKCVTAKVKIRYIKNKKYIHKQTIANNELIKDRNFNYVKRYLQIYGKCIDCGHEDYRVLEFDHVRGDKYKGIKTMCGFTNSIKSIKEEMRKCEIRCCNCHRIKTANDLGWKRFE